MFRMNGMSRAHGCAGATRVNFARHMKTLQNVAPELSGGYWQRVLVRQYTSQRPQLSRLRSQSPGTNVGVSPVIILMEYSDFSWHFLWTAEIHRLIDVHQVKRGVFCCHCYPKIVKSNCQEQRVLTVPHCRQWMYTACPLRHRDKTNFQVNNSHFWLTRHVNQNNLFTQTTEVTHHERTT